MLGVAVPSTINTHEFRPSAIPGSKFEIPSHVFVFTWHFGDSKLISTLHYFACSHSTYSILQTKLIIYCCFGTSTLSPWEKTTLLYIFSSTMEEEHTKVPSHNNPEEAATYVRSVNSLTDSFATSVHGFDRYLHLDAWQTFLHALSQLLLKLDSAYFTTLDTDVILKTIPNKACDAFLARPEEAAVRIQQRVSSDEIPDSPEVMSKMRLQIYHVSMEKANKPSPNYLVIFKMPTTTWQK